MWKMSYSKQSEMQAVQLTLLTTSTTPVHRPTYYVNYTATPTDEALHQRRTFTATGGLKTTQ